MKAGVLRGIISAVCFLNVVAFVVMVQMEEIMETAAVAPTAVDRGKSVMNVCLQ